MILAPSVMLPIKWDMPHGNQRVLHFVGPLVLWNGFMGERIALSQNLLLEIIDKLVIKDAYKSRGMLN